jgi:hypothetical protein
LYFLGDFCYLGCSCRGGLITQVLADQSVSQWIVSKRSSTLFNFAIGFNLGMHRFGALLPNKLEYFLTVLRLILDLVIEDFLRALIVANVKDVWWCYYGDRSVGASGRCAYRPDRCQDGDWRLSHHLGPCDTTTLIFCVTPPPLYSWPM